ncbi:MULTISPECIES: hypothetical protein [unclassified Micromonospora]|uniref:hypothetical protein n=1 Tax=unclassified Micromonospora TaxID=2617518 RepID=UPI0011827A87|nr:MULTISPECIES: hypothetical protein [unclassified Micromonospora]
MDADHAYGVQVGANNTQYNSYGYVPPVVRSAYAEQVRRIVPPDLKGRDAELAELEAFCTGDSDYRYAWWRAPAWAGKSALMSWFVLHPPAGVRIVSFFVTARHHQQNGRRAFLDNALEQLADLLEHRGLPVGLTDSTQEAHLLNMLSSAAAACQAADERLVLLVDGLDEDRGVTGGPDSYSIAGTLPRHPPSGLRVVVSSRPDPPLPPDVSSDHPLRVRCVIRELGQSAYAEVVRADAERELKRIMHADGTERVILGLITAASSGLSVADLAELAEEDQWLMEDYLNSFTGRTFRRAGDSYVLAHEELQSTAIKLLGPSRLRDYRQRLHEWADRYREQGWPVDTPEYLLLGYFRILSDQGDHTRMVQQATDAGRHDRMLDHTGGDSAALDEVALAEEALSTTGDCDLVSLCRLALHRADLERRNSHIPVDLPRLWAAVGNVARAEALVRSISEDGGIRDAALSLLAPETAAAGYHAHAERLVGLIPPRVFLSANEPGRAISQVARRIAEGGERERALRVARSAPTPFWQSRALAEVAIGVARAGASLAEAEELVWQTPMPYWRAQALGALGKEAARRGEPSLADRLADSAVAEVDALTNSGEKALIFGYLADGLIDTGRTDRARQLADHAIREAARVQESQQRIDALTEIGSLLATVVDRTELASLASLAEATLKDFRKKNEASPDHVVTRLVAAIGSAWYKAGDPERAAAVVSSIADISDQAKAMLEVIGSAAETGDLDYAKRLADALPDAEARDQAYGRAIVQAAAEVDEMDLAGLIDEITDRRKQASALTSWGFRVAKCGDRQTATALAERVETISRSIYDSRTELKLLAPLVSTLATLGHVEYARKAARRATLLFRLGHETGPSNLDLERFARGAALADDLETALELAGLISEPQRRAAMLIELATSAKGPDILRLAIGPLAAAEEAAKAGQTLPHYKMQKILTAWWVLGEDERAESLANWMADNGDTNQPSSPITTPVNWPMFSSTSEQKISQAGQARDEGLVEAVDAVARAGNFARAETLVNSIVDQHHRAEARTRLIVALARAGHGDRADTLARTGGTSNQRDRSLQQLAEIFIEQGSIDSAERALQSIEDGFSHARASIAVARKIEPTLAKPFLVSPIRQRRLSEIIDLLAVVCPAAVEAIADHMLNDRAARAGQPDDSAGPPVVETGMRNWLASCRSVSARHTRSSEK